MNCRDRENGTILEDGYCDSTQRPNEVVPCPLSLEFLRSINCPGNVHVLLHCKFSYCSTPSMTGAAKAYVLTCPCTRWLLKCTLLILISLSLSLSLFLFLSLSPHIGRCEYEPGYCSVIRLFGCTNPNFAQLVQSCCKSCPKQATPPTIPVTEVIESNVTAPAMGWDPTLVGVGIANT